jgi:hypothetical protein
VVTACHLTGACAAARKQNADSQPFGPFHLVSHRAGRQFP